ncbi:HEAT repeat domain-containing protein [Chryseolinea lacunae]|uniref:HEAT repeat domain-containing protein n=1 Tax=Chryseolinea lacunae TaxID=2801331 RepID=A0ABS1KVK0_9BACT|nr:HEAT repeat domain-containing protein [Chryseolinea lacunae]MBL0743333.1 HEAT repeat domain-containing protein [Chryseolinea lacunae]
MDSILQSLVERMNDKNDHIMAPGFDSSTTISWKAHREAEKLADRTLIPQLMTFIENEKDKKNRDAAYFILGHVAKNVGDQATAQFLIDRIEREKDKYVLSAMLDRLAHLEKPTGTDLTALIAATHDKRWQVGYAAIRALTNTDDAAAETTLLQILDTSDSSYELIYANGVLHKTGTPRALPFLEKHAKSRKRDVKHSALYAIEAIKQRHNLI